MSLNAIEKLLEDETGLDSNTIGKNVVHRVVRRHMELIGEMNEDGYFARLMEDKGELQSLIEDVTVPETWFFRDKKPFEFLREAVQSKWMPPSKSRPLRIMSIPCATGEEAYSIAMVMCNLGFDASTVRIDAVDISKRALERANIALYSENSFRGDEGGYRHRYFKRTEHGYQIVDAIRSMVKFTRANLLANEFLAGAEMYDIIFCRNVLIYFSPVLREKAVKKLHRLLAVDGILFVGHAEASSALGVNFSAVKYSGAFAFRKREKVLKAVDQSAQKNINFALDGMSPGKETNRQTETGLVKKRNKIRKSLKKELHAVGGPADARHDDVAFDDPLLADVRRLADKGRLKEAVVLCETALGRNALNADVYYLLGLIRQAESNEAEANSCFRKAIYLDPNHHDALLHLAVIAETQGNMVAAAVYRARASRVTKKQ